MNNTAANVRVGDKDKEARAQHNIYMCLAVIELGELFQIEAGR